MVHLYSEFYITFKKTIFKLIFIDMEKYLQN